MFVDPFRLAIALVPLAAYLLLVGLVNLRRRPLLTSGGSDLAVLGLALHGAGHCRSARVAAARAGHC